MTPIRKTYTFTGLNAQVTQTPIGFDYFKNPCNIAIGVDVVSGATATYTIQHTFDDIYSPSFSAATARWYPNASSGLSGGTVSVDGNYAFPLSAARLVTASGTSGTVNVTFIQAG